MSYLLVLECGCMVAISHDPLTNVARSRQIERRGSRCTDDTHEVGALIYQQDVAADRGRSNETGIDRQQMGD